jgi:signal transduction histidine kinase/ligand-binding sensor domain-containing protein
MHIPRPLPLILLWLLSAVGTLSALDPTKWISQYAHTAWRMQEGVFSGAPNAIAQTTDGYLWIGTQSGLIRFDGVRFVPWTPTDGNRLPSSRVKSLLAARDGSLWIGTMIGLAQWKNGNLMTFPATSGSVEAILEDRAGTIWIARANAADAEGPLCRVVETRLRCYGKTDGIPLSYAVSLADDNLGNLWIAGGPTLARWKPGSSSTYVPVRLNPAETFNGVEALASTPEGALWVGMVQSGPGLGLQQLLRGAWKAFVTPELDGSSLDVTALMLDRENSLWIGTLSEGIYRIQNQRVDHFGSADGLSSDSVNTFYQDREGNLWVATSKGIDSFHDFRVASFSTREGLTADQVNSVLASRDGTIRIGNFHSLDSLRQRIVSSIQARNGLPGRQVTSLLEDRTGRLWVGVDKDLSVYEDGHFSRIRRPDGSPIGAVVAMTEDVDGNIWAEAFGDPGELFRIQGFTIHEELSESQVPPADTLAADPQGGIWLGLASGDLARYRHHRLETFHLNRGSREGRVRQILVNSDGSVLGATELGLIGWRNGKTQTLTVRNGLPCDVIYAFLSDREAALWLYTPCGLIAIPKQELEIWWERPDATVKFRLFDVFDGAQPLASPFRPNASRSGDGRLWFANEHVLQMIDPSHLDLNLIQPPVHIEEIVADRKSYLAQDGLHLPALTRDLEIDYTALSFVVPQKVRFRYKLEGHDEAWQEAGARRQAFYSDLHPGTYRFHVIACNNDGVWNDKGATLDFRVLPAVYQTAWFRVACTLTGLFVVWALYRLRKHQIEAAISTRFEERLAERTRLARELHDTLLQTIQGSKMIVDDLLDPSAASRRPREVMGRLSNALAQASLELRTALNSLRNSTAAGNDLEEALRRAGEDCASRGLMNIEFVVEGTARHMYPIVRDEIYRIGHEAIRNACQHSGADHIEVRLSYGQDLVFSVHDSGRGIDPEVASHGKNDHFGLQGMRERAERAGGRLTFSTSPHSGTRLVLMIPGNKVFFNGGRRWRTLLMKIMRSPSGTNSGSDIV